MVGLLENKIVLVTGASSGIGAAAARLFVREGAKVTITARRSSQLQDVAASIDPGGDAVLAAAADTTVADDLDRAVRATVDRWGRLDGAFNSAGRSQGGGRLAEVDEARVDDVLDVDLKGTWLAMRAEITAMLDQGSGGAIVNVSSIIGTTGSPNQSIYAAAKAGLTAMSRCAAADYGPDGIRVNVLAPGTTQTDMIDAWEAREPGVTERLSALTTLGRLGTPDEMADAAAWLLSDRSSYVTGVVLGVDGGAALWPQ